jgi:hypothetical protein
MRLHFLPMMNMTSKRTIVPYSSIAKCRERAVAAPRSLRSVYLSSTRLNSLLPNEIKDGQQPRSSRGLLHVR